ncbi:toprim domain-containing protein [Xanthomonas campestris pv. campestris]|uniref:toprim domain-containing protein n=1 Tax=Xanthomonas campestris TaxID=339 RepID=UPI002367FDE2|nr:toprim domain-containing protein [Xanthomonas campestris]MDO0848272.1 toprim domain-containing protein [Xanthomonas campestris pv. campestris]MEB1415816.1 toprim domain-containing protein [Xanthomonas campestris pv. campestris]MEB1461543.1 toprim domain-containing protein [Xanthomonas campestris pv. campestris]MEB1502588.1 toprim domain-containing protein [Xanthomonas campestris pv. campestris]MEB1527197.1 toprim domain-containing protein [Xanthomonas campestris pv. campestris]
MQEDLRQQVLSRLERDYGLKHRSGTEYMRGGKCPSCSKKELYTNHLKPWVVKCGRQSKCGRELHVKDLYDDLFDDWSKRFQPTPAAPNAAADAYLQFSRGFDLAPLKGLYTQDSYYDRKITAGTATVRFALVKGGWWERLIDRPHRFGKQKARFAPGQSYAGMWWAAPAALTAMQTAREVWIVEGIFDAIALLQHGVCAVSAMSSNAFPEESLRELSKARMADLPTLVWALDNEPGARAYTHKHIKRAAALGFDSRAAQIVQRDSKKTDWNDLHLRAIASDDPRQWRNDVNEARYQGDLLVARSAVDKGLLMFEHDGRNDFWLDYRSRLYWFDFDTQRFDKLRKEKLGDIDADDGDEVAAEDLKKIKRAACSVQKIANCYPEALYFQRQEVTDESWYYFRVDFPHDGPSVKGTFTGGHVASASEFKKRLISLAAGAMFTGTGHQLDRLIEEQTEAIKTVDAIDFVGYSKEHRAYLLGDMAVRDGELVTANEEDYFEFDKLRLKTTQKSIRLEIQRDAEAFRVDWLPWLWQCFGTHGMVAMTFWFGSLFAEQIRAGHKSFPFLEATGEAGAGKTTLLTFLWKLLGRSDYEGFDPAKSSKAGRARAMGQVSGMPVVLLEADRSEPDKAHSKTFEWDELKDFFGGGTLATRGVRNGGNETYEPPFRGTIVITQNAAVDASEAILTRIVKLHFKRPQVTTESRIAADNLNALQVEEVSHFLVRAIRQERAILDLFAERVKVFEAKLRAQQDLRLERVIKNHAQMLALFDCLRLVITIPDDMVEQTRLALLDMALERQKAISADHAMVNEFWEVYEYLEATGHGKAVVNHSRDAQRIAINLNHFAARAAQFSQSVPDLKVLRALLGDSRRHKFIGANVAVNSAVLKDDLTGAGTTVKCWVFAK